MSRSINVDLIMEYKEILDFACSVKNKDISDLTLHGLMWEGKIIDNVRFTNVNFTEAEVNDCSFINCEFTNCYISCMNINNTCFSNCKITGDSKFNNRVFKDDSNNSLGFIWNGIDYSGRETQLDCLMKTIENIRYSNKSQLLGILRDVLSTRSKLCPDKDISITGVDFSCLKINVGDLQGINFVRCNFNDTIIECDEVVDVKFLNCSLHPIKFSGIYNMSKVEVHSGDGTVILDNCYVSSMVCGDTELKSILVKNMVKYL